jgi:hypothetical protein
MSVALTVMVRSGGRFAEHFETALAGLGIVAMPESDPCFIEQLVRGIGNYGTAEIEVAMAAQGGHWGQFQNAMAQRYKASIFPSA